MITLVLKELLVQKMMVARCCSTSSSSPLLFETPGMRRPWPSSPRWATCSSCSAVLGMRRLMRIGSGTACPFPRQIVGRVSSPAGLHGPGRTAHHGGACPPYLRRYHQGSWGCQPGERPGRRGCRDGAGQPVPAPLLRLWLHQVQGPEHAGLCGFLLPFHHRVQLREQTACLDRRPGQAWGPWSRLAPWASLP